MSSYPTSVPSPKSDGIHQLQFEKAAGMAKPAVQDQGTRCETCSVELPYEYYRQGDTTLCGKCAERVKAEQTQAPPPGLIGRSVMRGAGVAALCSVAYAAITWITGYELALIAVAVGYLIGNAVRKGAGGLGGRPFQVTAVALTYLAITFAYAPLIVKDMVEVGRTVEKEGASNPIYQTLTEAKTRGQSVDGTTLAAVLGLGVAALLTVALLAPFLNLLTGISGILGVIIILVGLHQAWAQTARDMRVVEGPLK